MRSSISAATQRYEALRNGSTTVSLGILDAYERELSSAKRTAENFASSHADERVARVQVMGAAIDDALDDMKDELKKLIRKGEGGQLTAADFYLSLEKVRAQRALLVRSLDSMSTTVDTVETIEADPTAYADSIYERMPAAAPEFSF